jgi:hypothetical protein
VARLVSMLAGLACLCYEIVLAAVPTGGLLALGLFLVGMPAGLWTLDREEAKSARGRLGQAANSVLDVSPAAAHARLADEYERLGEPGLARIERRLADEFTQMC